MEIEAAIVMSGHLLEKFLESIAQIRGVNGPAMVRVAQSPS